MTFLVGQGSILQNRFFRDFGAVLREIKRQKTPFDPPPQKKKEGIQ